MNPPPAPPDIGTLDEYLLMTRHPNRQYFYDSTLCSQCLDRKEITNLRGCETCDLMICNSCAAVTHTNEEANPKCGERCKKFTAQYGEIICGAISHCSTLRQLRNVDATAEAHWDCPACTEKLPTWDAFLSHYETCGALPAEDPCTREVIDPYGHTLVASCE